MRKPAKAASGTNRSPGLASMEILSTGQTSQTTTKAANSGKKRQQWKPEYFTGLWTHGKEPEFWSRYPFSSMWARSGIYLKYYCGACGRKLCKTWDNCHACGQEVDWSHTKNWRGHPLKYTGEALWEWHEKEKNGVCERYGTMDAFAASEPSLFNEDDIRRKKDALAKKKRKSNDKILG